VYNNHVLSSMQQVPFMADTGHLPRMGFEPNSMHPANDSVNEFHDWVTARASKAKAVLVKAKDKFKLYYNCQLMPALEIKVGNRVWVDASDIKMTCPSPKFSDKQLRPFKVVKVIGKGAYKLKLPPRYSQLELVKPDPLPSRPRSDKLPPVLQAGTDERWEVTEILEARICYGSLWYMV
jgi:hypothetical protein